MKAQLGAGDANTLIRYRYDDLKIQHAMILRGCGKDDIGLLNSRKAYVQKKNSRMKEISTGWAN